MPVRFGVVLVPIVRWILARLLDLAAVLVAAGWWVWRELRGARGELAEGMAAADLDTGRLPWTDGP